MPLARFRKVIPICSLSLAPTWKETVAAAVEQVDPVELGLRADAVDLGRELVDLVLDRRAGGGVQRAVLVLDGQLADALQHGVDLVEVALGGLHHGDAVLDVLLGLREAADLRPHRLGDAEAGGVVGRAVDAVAGGETFHRLRDLGRVGLEIPRGVHRLDVVGDAKGHPLSFLCPWREVLGGSASSRRLGLLGGRRDVVGKLRDVRRCGGTVLRLDGRPDLFPVDRDGLGGGDADANARAGLTSITSTTTSSPTMIFSPGRRVMMSIFQIPPWIPRLGDSSVRL